MDLDESILQIAFPEEDGIYKVVQFFVDNIPCMEFGRFGKTDHSFLVAEFAKKIGVGIVGKDTPIGVLPFLSDEDRYKMPGMGRCELKMVQEMRVAEFFGYSTDYRIGISEEHLELSKSLTPSIRMWYNPKRKK